jgi:hypothetical protein
VTVSPKDDALFLAISGACTVVSSDLRDFIWKWRGSVAPSWIYEGGPAHVAGREDQKGVQRAPVVHVCSAG